MGTSDSKPQSKNESFARVTISVPQKTNVSQPGVNRPPPPNSNPNAACPCVRLNNPEYAVHKQYTDAQSIQQVRGMEEWTSYDRWTTTCIV